MQEIYTKADLRFAIFKLEQKQAEEGKLLKEQFRLVYSSIKPINLLKGTLKDITSSPYLVDNLLGTVVGLATGYLSRKIVVGTSGNIVRKLLGSLLQFGVSNVVAQHPQGIKSIGQFVFQHILRKKEGNGHEQSE